MSSSKSQIPFTDQSSADIMADLAPALEVMAPDFRERVKVLGERATRLDVVISLLNGEVPLRLMGPAPGLLGDSTAPSVPVASLSPTPASSGRSRKPAKRPAPTQGTPRGSVAYRADVVEVLLSIVEAPAPASDPSIAPRAAAIAQLKKLRIDTAVLSQTGGANFPRWVRALYLRTIDEVKRTEFMMRIQMAKGWTNAQLAAIIETGKFPEAAAEKAVPLDLATHELDLMRLELIEAKKKGGAKAYDEVSLDINKRLNAHLGPPKGKRLHIVRVVSQLGGRKIVGVYARLLVYARRESLEAFQVMLARLKAATGKSDKALTKIAHDHEDWKKVAGTSEAATPVTSSAPAAPN